MRTVSLLMWEPRYVTIVISSGGPSSLVPPGWYVTRDAVRPGQAELRAGLELNHIDTWDVTKLGWLKLGHRVGWIYKFITEFAELLFLI